MITVLPILLTEYVPVEHTLHSKVHQLLMPVHLVLPGLWSQLQLIRHHGLEAGRKDVLRRVIAEPECAMPK